MYIYTTVAFDECRRYGNPYGDVKRSRVTANKRACYLFLDLLSPFPPSSTLGNFTSRHVDDVGASLQPIQSRDIDIVHKPRVWLAFPPRSRLQTTYTSLGTYIRNIVVSGSRISTRFGPCRKRLRSFSSSSDHARVSVDLVTRLVRSRPFRKY